MLSAKAGERIGVAGAASRVEFADRQRSHPWIARGQHERLFDVAESRPGVAAVGILRQRGIGEVQDVDVDVERERASREVIKRGRGDTSWIGGQCLAGGHVQAKPGGLLALPVRSQLRLHPEPCHLVGLKQRPGAERVGEGVHATRQRQRVR